MGINRSWMLGGAAAAAFLCLGVIAHPATAVVVTEGCGDQFSRAGEQCTLAELAGNGGSIQVGDKRFSNWRDFSFNLGFAEDDEGDQAGFSIEIQTIDGLGFIQGETDDSGGAFADGLSSGSSGVGGSTAFVFVGSDDDGAATTSFFGSDTTAAALANYRSPTIVPLEGTGSDPRIGLRYEFPQSPMSELADDGVFDQDTFGTGAIARVADTNAPQEAFGLSINQFSYDLELVDDGRPDFGALQITMDEVFLTESDAAPNGFVAIFEEIFALDPVSGAVGDLLGRKVVTEGDLGGSTFINIDIKQLNGITIDLGIDLEIEFDAASAEESVFEVNQDFFADNDELIADLALVANLFPGDQFIDMAAFDGQTALHVEKTLLMIADASIADTDALAELTSFEERYKQEGAQAIPEPGTLGLLAAGIAGIAGFAVARRRKRAA